MLGLLESPHCVNKNSAAVSSQVEQAKRYAMPPMTSRGSGRALLAPAPARRGVVAGAAAVMGCHTPATARVNLNAPTRMYTPWPRADIPGTRSGESTGRIDGANTEQPRAPRPAPEVLSWVLCGVLS
jgi:hypothetical protein